MTKNQRNNIENVKINESNTYLLYELTKTNKCIQSSGVLVT